MCTEILYLFLSNFFETLIFKVSLFVTKTNLVKKTVAMCIVQVCQVLSGDQYNQ